MAAASEPGGARRVATLALPPLVAWGLLRLVVTIASSGIRAVNFQPATWTRVDSFNYLSIVTHGRTLVACPADLRRLIPSAVWCGTAAWFPGYPDLIRVFTWFGPSAPVVGEVVANTACLGLLALCWIGCLDARLTAPNLLLLAGVAVFPGAVYLVAIFPMSLALFGVLASLVLLRHRRRCWAALALAVAVASYPSAAYVLVAFAVALAASAEVGQRFRAASWALVAALPLLAIAVHDQIVFGRWNTYSMLGAEAGNRLVPPANPLLELWRLLVEESAMPQRIARVDHAPWAAHLLAIQAVVAGVIVAGALVACLRARRAGLDPVLDLYAAGCGIMVWLGVLMSGTTGAWNRSVVLAAPALLVWRRLPPPLLAAVVVLEAVVTMAISRYFFTRVLI